jgi:transcriptional regulator with XRE-family HTH domain
MQRRPSSNGKGPRGEHATEVLRALGKKLKLQRIEQGFTLQNVADKTGVSVAMLSLVERGKVSPSVGTLVAINSILNLHMPELLGANPPGDRAVTAAKAQTVVRSLVGVIHRILVDDQSRGLQMTLNHYSPGSANSPQPIKHTGYEYGFVLDGALEVTVDGNKHLLEAGDVISYWSDQPHRIVNRGKKKARAIWINLRTS